MMRGDWMHEAMQYRDIDREAQRKAEEAMSDKGAAVETDALIGSFKYEGAGDYIDALAKHARRLERQRDEAVALLKAYLSTGGTPQKWRKKTLDLADCDAHARAFLASLERK